MVIDDATPDMNTFDVAVELLWSGFVAHQPCGHNVGRVTIRGVLHHELGFFEDKLWF